MSLANGRPYLAIPGPSVMPDRVLQAMHRPAPNIYEGDLVDLVQTVVRDLKHVAQTKANVAIYICNGHGTWEAALANTITPGATVLVPATGRFGLGWADAARGRGIDVQMLDFGTQSPIDPARVEAALRADTTHKIKAILATHVDTASTVRNDIVALRQALDATGHPALLMTDNIASLVCDRFEMDAWGVDVMIAASQKGLMTPPGLGFVFFSDKAAAVRRSLPLVSRYWDWIPRADPDEFYQLFCGTAPTHHIFGLRAALDMIKEEGLENIWTRHAVLARAVWAACDVWGQGGPLQMNIADPSARSHAVTTLQLGAPMAGQLREWTDKQAGVTLGIGLGMNNPDDPKGLGAFRIAHMGHLNAHMVLGALGVIEAGLSALDIPHGSGGVGAAAQVVADHIRSQS